MAIAFTPGKGIPRARVGYSRVFAGAAGCGAGRAGGLGIRWLSGIKATGSLGGMISSYTLHNIASLPIINQGKYTKKYDA
jgi:hypothetical protein